MELHTFVLSRIRFPAMAASSLLIYWDTYSFLREYDPEKRLIIAAVGWVAPYNRGNGMPWTEKI